MAVIGVGHLGRHHARILNGLPDVELVGVADTSRDQAQIIGEQLNVPHYSDFNQLLGQVDAVSVVVPTIYHHQVAKTFLEEGIPVLVEKPIATTVAQADDLIATAKRSNVALQVGHIERFNPAFEELAGRPMHPCFIECERHGPFTGRSTDIGVVLDLMIHDIDLLLSLVGSRVTHVDALGAAVFGGHEDMVNARFIFESGCVAHVTASRISPNAKRRLRVWASEGYAGIDFVRKRLVLVQPSEELRKHGLMMHRLDPAQRASFQNDVFTKHLNSLDMKCDRPEDQLTSELKSFVKCVRLNLTPRVTGEDGRDALELAERVITSLREHKWEGRPDGAVGPRNLPHAHGQLFEVKRSQREAA
ncbi:Gfo/Idh/MocA family oxidoreductase [Telmatocola sphagniphila]|uniref:Gfo/Idh/MocA family oxidoreductase n=2 Tax=Telmatocola sphagniphila TaxID=1123043 RepID=A0A8E6EXE0_9BACT|nr:Gfo/Idh/MocA family oxidoreductase [Telmatocola sphagniphila]